MSYKPTDPLVRFWRFVRFSPDGCWLWTGATGGPRNPYGAFSISRSVAVRAHKWIWEKFNGPVPKGMHLHHACGATICVNPSHLELVTPRDHIIIRHPDHFIAKKSRQTTCKNGHPFDHYGTLKGGGRCRRCSICDAAREKERYRRKKEAAA